MEIERKFLVKKENLPENLEQYPCKVIEQGYLCTEPVVRIRKSNDNYYLTYKSKSEVKNVFDDASKMGLKVIRIWGNLDVGKKTGEIDSQSGHETFERNNDGTGEKDGVYFQYWDDEAGKPVVN